MRLIGRLHELERLRQITGPLVTVRGPAGVGKSRLVQEAWPEATFCFLAGIEEDGLLSAMARGLGVESVAGVPLAVAVQRALSQARAPVVLDGPDRCLDALRVRLQSWFVEAELPTIIVTARALLGVSEEQELELAPPPVEDALSIWAQACLSHGLRSDPEVARAIVAKLDRLPLALEWMAPRAALLGEKACLQGIDNRQVRIDPLAVALDDSLATLAEPELAALSALCAFEDGATAAALETISPAHVAAVDKLVRRSLVRLRSRPMESARVTPYRSVVEHMRARVQQDSGWDDLCRAHAEAVVGIVEGAAPNEYAARRSTAAERSELEAVRSRFTDLAPELAARAALCLLPLELTDDAMSRARDSLAMLVPKLTDPTLSSATRLGLAQLQRRLGDFDDARDNVASVLEASPGSIDALLELAHRDRQQSRLDAALAGYQQALSLAMANEDRRRECVALGELGRMLQSLGRLAEAKERHLEAIALAHELGLSHREALERSLYARATHRAGDVREAVKLHERALSLHEAAGDRRLAAAERGHLGFCRHELGELDDAESAFRESIAGLAAVGDVMLEHIERVLLARLLADAGRCAEARLELAIANTLAVPLSLPRLQLTQGLVTGLVALKEGKSAAAREALRQAQSLGPLSEVGYEVLLPAWLALAEKELGAADDAEARLAQCEAAVARLQAPGLRAAFDVLAASVRGQPAPEVSDDLRASSSDLRRALSLTGAEPSIAALFVATDGRTARLPDGTEVDLRRRTAPRRLLLALATARRDTPGKALDRDQLIEAGWPGERMRPEAADKRLRTAIWTLRKEGLEAVLLTRDEGYLLDPLVPLAD